MIYFKLQYDTSTYNVRHQDFKVTVMMDGKYLNMQSNIAPNHPIMGKGMDDK